MTHQIRFIAIGALALVVVLGLSACGLGRPSADEQATYGQGFPGGMMGAGMMDGRHMGGMMGSGGMMGGGMMGGGMMGNYDNGQSFPAAEPTPLGATPIPVDREIQITAFNPRFVPAQITVQPGATVRFVVTNNDPYLHNFISQDAGIPFLNLPGNTTQTVTWTAPTTEGSYPAFCTLHPGMTLTINVKHN